MASKITYTDKEYLINDTTIPDKNKVLDTDMNEIKQVVNDNADELDEATENISNLQEQVDINSGDITDIKEEQTTQNNKISSLETDNTTNKTNISNLQGRVASSETAISNLQRDKADKSEIPTDLSQLSNEETKFVNEEQLNKAVDDEATARQNADNNIQSQINATNENVSTNANNISNLQTTKANVNDVYNKEQSDNLLNNKVDKVSGKGLSTNDFNNTYKNNVDSNTQARHTHSNKTILDNTTASYTTEKDTKLNGIETGANKTIVDSSINNTSTNPVQNKKIKEALDTKVDKEAGKSLISDTEIERLAGVDNYDDSAIQSEIAQLQQENKNLRKAGYKLNGTGENVTLNKTSDNRFVKLDIKGNKKQDSYEGDNLFNAKEAFASQIQSGLVSINASGQVILNGQFNSTNRAFTVTLPAGTYLASEAKSILHLRWEGADALFKRTTPITFNEETTLTGYIASNTYTNEVLEPMIYLSNIQITDYEPYTYEQPAPNPNYECPVKAVGEKYNIMNFDVEGQNSKVTVNDDGTITLNGTGGFAIKLEPIILQANETYKQKIEVVSGSVSAGDINNAFMSFNGSTWLSTNVYVSYTPNADSTVNGIWINANATFNNLKIRIWGYKGIDEKLFTPYGMGNVNTEIVNKNWFDFSKVEEGDLNPQTGKDTAGTNVWRTPHIPVKPSTVCTLKTGNTATKRMFFYDKDKNMIHTNLFTTGVSPFTTTADTCYVRFKSVNENFASTSMLVEGNYTVETMPDYTPHQEQVYNIPCQKPMRAIGDVRDTFFKNTVDSEYYNSELELNAWYERHPIVEIEVDGNLEGFHFGFTFNSGAGNVYYGNAEYKAFVKPATNISVGAVMCNRLIVTTEAKTLNGDIGISITQNKCIQITLGGSYLTKETKNSYASQNPLIIWAQAETPEYLKCTDAQVEVLEELSKATSYYEQTNIFSINEVSPIYDTTAVADMNLIIDPMDARLTLAEG